MKNLLLTTTCLAATAAFGQAKKEKPARLPNIVIILADDMGYGDLGVQNQKSKIPTPHLDNLAKEGIRFTNAHSSSGISTPSRYALLTGRYHWRKFHGIVDSWEPSVFDKDEFTLPGMLKKGGYTTACIGKWHLGWDWKGIIHEGAQQIVVDGKKTWGPDAFQWDKPVPDGPTAHGFDYYFGDDVPNFPPYCWFENDRILTPPTTILKLKEKPVEGSWEARPGPAVENWDFYNVMPTVTKKAVEWIKNQKADQPFFLYFPMTSPHAPILPTKEWQGKSGAGGYGDYMMQSDWCAGEILKALKEAGFEKNTIVIFSSDNGPEHYAYERSRTYGHFSMGQLRGLKRDIWEGGHRVPLIVKWPENIKAGTVSDELISHVDFVKTLAGITGMTLPDNVAGDSYNQATLLKGESKSKRNSIVYNTFEKYAIQKDNWVLIDASNGEHTKMPEWFKIKENYTNDTVGNLLYKLNNDISQHKNLIKDYPEKAAELRKELNLIRGISNNTN